VSALKWIRQRAADEEAYTLIELLTVVAIFGIVTGALTTLFVAATNSEVDTNLRFQAQQNARLGFSQLRKDVHCASSSVVSNGGATVVLTLPAQCPGTPTVTWCASSVSASRYKLYRNVGGTCPASGKEYADYLTSNAVFTATAQSTASLAKVKARVSVNRNTSRSLNAYTLEDEIVLRNSTRA
jgi:prepilin-type N-terminal cleavage/methylation domain-containing protein